MLRVKAYSEIGTKTPFNFVLFIPRRAMPKQRRSNQEQSKSIPENPLRFAALAPAARRLQQPAQHAARRKRPQMLCHILKLVRVGGGENLFARGQQPLFH